MTRNNILIALSAVVFGGTLLVAALTPNPKTAKIEKDKIQIGMTKADVISTLDRPHTQEQLSERYVVWYYGSRERFGTYREITFDRQGLVVDHEIERLVCATNRFRFIQ
jgi:outer membrane protein assembly factor BamE (lipoprotein component of BamABCDE complex)